MVKPNSVKDDLVVQALVGGLYEAEADGTVWSNKTGRRKPLKAARLRSGYRVVNLLIDGQSLTVYVHRLVAHAHCARPSLATDEVNHKNGVKGDDRADNLEWVTRPQNGRHAYSAGLRLPPNMKVNDPILRQEVAKLLAEGKSRRAIAKIIGLSVPTVNKMATLILI